MKKHEPEPSWMVLFCTIFVAAALIPKTTTAQETDPSSYYIQQASTAYTVQDYAGSIVVYQNSLRFRPDNPTVVYNIACCYILMGDKKEALKWLSKAVELGMYIFDGDEDMNNIRETREYRKILARADKLLAEVKNKSTDPVVILPRDCVPNKPYPLLVAMHGYGGELQGFSRTFVNTCNRKRYILCCPYGPVVMGRAAFHWGDGEQDGLAEKRIMESVKLMRAEYNIDISRIFLAGFSQGGYMTYLLGSRTQRFFVGPFPLPSATTASAEDICRRRLGTA